jgi:hypothetical protein
MSFYIVQAGETVYAVLQGSDVNDWGLVTTKLTMQLRVLEAPLEAAGQFHERWLDWGGTFAAAIEGGKQLSAATPPAGSRHLCTRESKAYRQRRRHSGVDVMRLVDDGIVRRQERSEFIGEYGDYVLDVLMQVVG